MTLNKFQFPDSDAPAIITPESTVSYRELNERFSWIADNLVKRGVQPGDRVAIQSVNSLEVLLLLPALWSIGAVAVPFSERFPVNEILALAEKYGCKYFLPASQLADRPASTKLSVIPLSEATAFPSEVKNGIYPAWQLENLASIILTSGSSGNPKAVVHSLANHYYSAIGSHENIPFGRGGRWLLSLPMYHVGGMAILFRAWTAEGAIALPHPEMTLQDAIEQLQPSHISLVSTQLYRLLKTASGRRSLRRMKAVLLGGSAIPENLLREAWTLEIPVHTSYGSSEMSSQITTTPANASLKELQTSGKLLPHREITIAADGEILVRGKTLFQGYHVDDKIMPAVDTAGWFGSGDIGHLDAQGNLIVTGRKDNMFISGGENIQPEEIEKHLSHIDGVIRCMVVPVIHHEFGMRPVAFIDMRNGGKLDTSALRLQLEKKLPRFKVPDKFLPWPKDSQSSGIKPDRQAMAKIAAAG